MTSRGHTTFTGLSLHATHLCGARRHLENVDKNHIVLIFIFLLYTTVRASSFSKDVCAETKCNSWLLLQSFF